MTLCDREGASYLRIFNHDSGTACLVALGGMLGEKALHRSANKAIKIKRGTVALILREMCPL